MTLNKDEKLLFSIGIITVALYVLFSLLSLSGCSGYQTSAAEQSDSLTVWIDSVINNYELPPDTLELFGDTICVPSSDNIKEQTDSLSNKLMDDINIILDQK